MPQRRSLSVASNFKDLFWALALFVLLAGCQDPSQIERIALQGVAPLVSDTDSADWHGHDPAADGEEEEGYEAGELLLPFACTRATAAQMATIDRGNAKFDQFMRGCWAATGNSRWCEQLTRPNPASRSVFICTYGEDRPHRLIHPDESTWSHAYKAVQLIQAMENAGIAVQQIYNWWRPEPYNRNVGGAAGRHPYGTSVDVRFSSLRDMERGFQKLCSWRKRGVLRAVGYYGSTGLHFGIGDRLANNWGKACP